MLQLSPFILQQGNEQLIRVYCCVLQPLGFGRNDPWSLWFAAPWPPATVTRRAFWVPPAQVPTVGYLAEVRVGGRRADGADVAAGGAAWDEVSRGPLSGQGTHGAARCVAVDEGEVQPVGAGRADGTLQAVERELGVSPDGFVLESAPCQATPHRL